MVELGVDVFRTTGTGDAFPSDFVVPYSPDDRKLRVSIARVDERLDVFDDICTCVPESCLELDNQEPADATPLHL
jgi:3-phenylpropionate/trans-cinnamate dioxygenase ferredoxin component